MASATNRRQFKDLLTCRQVLNIMVILGFMFNYMLRVNMTIAIVSMVIDAPKPNDTGLHTNGHNVSDDVVGRLESASLVINGTNPPPLVREELPNMVTDENGHTRFNWDKYAQNMILGCFFWGYILTELPGGRMAEVIGARRVFGGGMLAASLITLLTPVTCTWNFIAVIVLRTLLGFFLGATWPAMPPMAAKWIPPLERSKFIANMMASSLGAALTMPVCGYLLATFGWESVFYTTGGIGLIWSIAWFFLVYDSPADHPRISQEERMEIESKIALAAGKGTKPSRVPWMAILLSAPVWAIIICHGCSVFCYFTVVNQLPTYMKEVLHFDVKSNGLFSSLPYLGKYIMAVLASYFADRIMKSGRFSVTMTRKAFTTFAVLTPGFLMVLQAFWGEDPGLSIAIFTCSLFFNGAVTAGYLANGLDIAPNFSGTIFGLANTLSSLGGWLSTAIVAALTSTNHTFAQWRYVFWVLVAAYVIGASTFLFFGSGKLQPWNSVDKSVEMQPLRSKKEGEEDAIKNGEAVP